MGRNFQELVAARHHGIETGNLSPVTPPCLLDETCRMDFQLLATHLAGIASIADISSSTPKDTFSVFCILKQTLMAAKQNLLGDDYSRQLEGYLESAFNHRFDPDLMCLYATFGGYSGFTREDSFEFGSLDRNEIIKALGRVNPRNIDMQVVSGELDAYLGTIDKNQGVESAEVYWKNEGKEEYPVLAQLVIPLFSFPHSMKAVQTIRDMKSFIHYHVRMKKEGAADSSISDEMAISCNRHLLIRWDMDFQ